MSKYTTEVRRICEYLSQDNTIKEDIANASCIIPPSVGFKSVDDIINTAAPKIFNFSWPIFDEAYRLPLEKKILRHYYTREICEETLGLWLLRLQDTMNMIMPYYNQLYESELLKFNPLYNTEISTVHARSGKTSDDTTSSGLRNETQDRSETDHLTETDVKAQTTNKTNESAENTIQSDYRSDNGASDKSSSGSSLSGSLEYGNANKQDLYSDTPQGDVTGILSDSKKYLTNARIISDTSSNTGSANAVSTDQEHVGSSYDSAGGSDARSTSNETGRDSVDSVGNRSENATKNVDGSVSSSNVSSSIRNILNIDDYVDHVSGKRGYTSYSQLLKEFRDTFLNIDQMVIEELSTLFFGLW